MNKREWTVSAIAVALAVPAASARTAFNMGSFAGTFGTDVCSTPHR
ncbi:MAG: hypothetical protein ACXVRK_12120 [Gaiellaceae bacterium]